MKSHKINKILGLVAIGINVLFVFKSLYLLYVYNFTGILFLFMYPNWVLVINALLGIIGIYISILLFKNMIGIKLFLILTFVLWGIMLFFFYVIGKQVNNIRKRRLFKITAVLVYWLIVWGICYYQCAIEAVRNWNDMMNGNVG